jgi:hypothetical protein
MRPASARRKPHTVRSSVLLPAPLAPAQRCKSAHEARGAAQQDCAQPWPWKWAAQPQRRPTAGARPSRQHSPTRPTRWPGMTRNDASVSRSRSPAPMHTSSITSAAPELREAEWISHTCQHAHAGRDSEYGGARLAAQDCGTEGDGCGSRHRGRSRFLGHRGRQSTRRRTHRRALHGPRRGAAGARHSTRGRSRGRGARSAQHAG